MAARYTEADITRFRRRAYELGMLARMSFFRRPAAELVAICNGVGGQDAWGSDILTWIYRNYQAEAAIHDEGYDTGGTAEDRRRLDLEFYLNLQVGWEDRYRTLRWINPRALIDRRKIYLAYKAVSALGHNYFRYR